MANVNDIKPLRLTISGKHPKKKKQKTNSTFSYWFLVMHSICWQKKMETKLSAFNYFGNWTVKNWWTAHDWFWNFSSAINFCWFFNQTDMPLTHCRRQVCTHCCCCDDGCVHVAGHVMKIKSQYWIWTFTAYTVYRIHIFVEHPSLPMHFRYFNQYIFHSIRLDYVLV